MFKITTLWFWSYIVLCEPFNETTLHLPDNRLALISNHKQPLCCSLHFPHVISRLVFLHTFHVQKMQGIVSIVSSALGFYTIEVEILLNNI
jgi:hypothetical protein